MKQSTLLTVAAGLALSVVLLQGCKGSHEQPANSMDNNSMMSAPAAAPAAPAAPAAAPAAPAAPASDAVPPQSFEQNDGAVQVQDAQHAQQ